MGNTASTATSSSALTRNNVKINGSGEIPMMFAHGFGCDQNMWRFVEPEFRGSYQTILFDHVGAGNSNLSAYDSTKYARLQGYADDILEICEELQLAPVVFVGHSVSAMIGALAALKAPDRFRNLIMVGPSPRYINDETYFGGFKQEDVLGLLEVLDNNYLGWSTSMAPAIMGNADRPELGEELAASFCRTDPTIARQFAHVTFLSDNRDDLRLVRTPTLILQCSDDAIAPQTVGEFVHRSIPGSEFVLLKATGHCPNLSAPTETVEAIRAYLGWSEPDCTSRAEAGA